MTAPIMDIVLKQGWDPQIVQFVMDNVLQGITDPSEILLFFTIHKKLGLDPIQRDIWVIPLGGKKTLVTSIKALRKIADRTGKFFPSPRKTEFVYEGEGKDRKLVSATKYICKLTPNGILAEGCSTATMASYGMDHHNGKQKGACWKTFPEVMLEKCAEARALRENFPEHLGELYIEEELTQEKAQTVQAELVQLPNLGSSELKESQEPRTGEDMSILAMRVAKECDLDAIDVEQYLFDWQKHCPLQPKIDFLLVQDKQRLLDSYGRWWEKRSPRSA